MRILVFEQVCATPPDERPADWHALLPEAQAMLGALVADLVAVPGWHVAAIVARDAAASLDLTGCEICDVETRTAGAEAFVAEQVARSDAAWFVCPGVEYFDWLREEALVSRLVSPDRAFAKLAADKQAAAEHLRRAGVLVSQGAAFGGGQLSPDSAEIESLGLPAVIKPRHGCGCQETWLLRTRDDARRCLAGIIRAPEAVAGGWRLEGYVPGIAASVAVLCGSDGLWTLPACRQHIDVATSGAMSYVGGSLPLPAELAGRAQRLAQQAVGAMPAPRGYVGVDLVLGAASDGRDDRVIEINHRLTTSYIGLRRSAKVNLAGATLEVVAGREPDLIFRDVNVSFTPAGRVEEWG